VNWSSIATTRRTTVILSDLREAHLDRLFQMLTNEIIGPRYRLLCGRDVQIELSLTTSDGL
jgi:hypothetical protein